eukprot:2109259-Pyramimonas_sp.AAC.1
MLLCRLLHGRRQGVAVGPARIGPCADSHRVVDLCMSMVAPPRHCGCAYLMVAAKVSTPPSWE